MIKIDKLTDELGNFNDSYEVLKFLIQNCKANTVTSTDMVFFLRRHNKHFQNNNCSPGLLKVLKSPNEHDNVEICITYLNQRCFGFLSDEVRGLLN